MIAKKFAKTKGFPKHLFFNGQGEHKVSEVSLLFGKEGH